MKPSRPFSDPSAFENKILKIDGGKNEVSPNLRDSS